MREKFNKLDKIVRILLLILPFVNWISELVIRWTDFIATKQAKELIFAVIVIPFGVFMGWVDVIWTLLNDEVLVLK